jgi:hypothetical protein
VKRLLVTVLLLGACASSSKLTGPPPAPAETANLESLHVELRNSDLELHNLRLNEDGPIGAGGDCRRIKQLRDNIGALAERICRIATQEPPGSQAADYCSDGKSRCAYATERASARRCTTATLQ